MSFQNKVVLMSKEGGCLANGDISYDSVSRIDSKRPHQWFMDGEATLFPSKKQAIDVSVSSPFDGVPASTLPPWGNVSGFSSGPSQISEQLFDTDASRDPSFDERNIASLNASSLQMGSKGIDSMSYSLEDPKLGLNYDGIRKVKVSEVRDPENRLSISTGPSYTREANDGIPVAQGHGKVDGRGISMSMNYGQEEDNVASFDQSYGRDDDTFVSMGQTYTNDASNTLAMGNQMTNLFNEADNIMQIAENFGKGNDSDIMPISHTYKGDISITMTRDYIKGDNLTTAIAPSNSECERRELSTGHSFNKGESSVICFGGYNDDDDANVSGRLMCDYDSLIGQPSVQGCNTLNQKDLTLSNGNAAIVAAQGIASGVENTSKKKEDTKSTKRTPPNNFPSNVRSLLSTGILDEVPVKYIAWSQEKELRGIIKGTGYLCGCQPCNFSKVINAYEFERHAGCKTKHPNNHIYFDNGKTIYGIVQELRNTPQNMLFDVIQTITGSPINQKSFRLWKDSFLAATRELQRIYGKDERHQP